MVSGSTPIPTNITSSVSRPSSGSARSPLAVPTTKNPPRRVCPITAPIGTAITAAMTRACTV